MQPTTTVAQANPLHGFTRASLLRTLAQADWLSQNRIIGWGAILLALQAAFLTFLVLWYHNVFGPVEPIASDFISFYAAGKLALAGTPMLAYDHAAHQAMEIATANANILYQFFFYPPVFLLLCAPLALLPYMAAFILFQAATITGWLLVMRRILRASGWTWCIPMLAYPSVFWTLGQGQNSFLTTALLAGTTLLLDERPVIAGVLLGLMCYKPHLALLAPIALAAGGYRRSFAAAAVTVTALLGLSVVLFGTQTWQAYLTAFAGSQSVYETGRIDFFAYVTPYGAARVLGAGAHVAHLLQAAVSIAAAATVAWIWRRNSGPAERSAALAAGILLSIPLALIYDLLLLTIAIAWLAYAGRRTGFLPWEKLALFACFLVPLIARHVGRELHIPLAPLACAALLALCVARTRRAATGGAPVSPAISSAQSGWLRWKGSGQSAL